MLSVFGCVQDSSRTVDSSAAINDLRVLWCVFVCVLDRTVTVTVLQLKMISEFCDVGVVVYWTRQ